jgi:hypothetical protein
MSGTRWKSWQAMESAMQAAQDAKADEAFVHPADIIDAAERGPEAPPAPGPAFGDIFRNMMALCLPPRSYGDERRWAAGYHRMCALCYRLAPEMFENMTRQQIADRLGISLRAFGKQLEYADAILAGRIKPGQADDTE